MEKQLLLEIEFIFSFKYFLSFFEKCILFKNNLKSEPIFFQV